jgi:hypothetical protein
MTQEEAVKKGVSFYVYSHTLNPLRAFFSKERVFLMRGLTASMFQVTCGTCGCLAAGHDGRRGPKTGPVVDVYSHTFSPLPACFPKRSLSNPIQSAEAMPLLCMCVHVWLQGMTEEEAAKKGLLFHRDI